MDILANYLQIYADLEKETQQRLMTMLSFLSLSNKTIDKSKAELTISVHFNH